MNITINGSLETLPREVATVADLIRFKNISEKGTAVACNARLVPRTKWEDTPLHELDSISVISAAYGG